MIYGSNAMGGVVNIVTRHAVTDGVTTQLQLQGGSYGTCEASATSRVRSGKFFGVAGANYGRTDGHRPHSAFEQVSGFLKLGYDFTSHWTLSGYVNMTHFRSSNPGTVSSPLIDNDMKITRGMAALSLTNDFDYTSGALHLYYNWGHHRINDGYRQGGTPQSAEYLHNDRMGGFSIYQSAVLFQGNRTTVGLDYQNFGGHAWNRTIANGSETDIANRTVQDVAGYVDFRQDLATWVSAHAGIRLDHHSVSGSQWIPQGGLTFRLPHQAEVRVVAGKGFRNATIRELYMYRPANADLEPERLMNYELSFKQRLLNSRLTYGINAFYLKADNLIQTAFIDGKPLNINTGKTEHSGVELELDYRITPHFAMNGNYSFLHMSNLQLAAPEHKLFLGGQYRRGKFNVNVGLLYIAGLYTAVGEQAHKESFGLLNATISYALTQGLRIFVKGENLLAQRYETVAGFPMPKATMMGGISWNF